MSRYIVSRLSDFRGPQALRREAGMEMPGSWEPSVPSKGARPQGAWHEDAGIEGTVHPPGWNPGPGYGGDGVFAGGWTVSTVPVQELGRRVARFLAISALAGLAAVAGLVTLAVVAFQHGGTLAALLVLLGVPALRGLAGGRAARGGHALAEPGDLGGARRPGGPGVLADGPAGAPALASGADRRPQRHHQVAERGARLAFRAGVPGVLRAVALAVIAGERDQRGPGRAGELEPDRRGPGRALPAGHGLAVFAGGRVPGRPGRGRRRGDPVEQVVRVECDRWLVAV